MPVQEAAVLEWKLSLNEEAISSEDHLSADVSLDD